MYKVKLLTKRYYYRLPDHNFHSLINLMNLSTYVSLSFLFLYSRHFKLFMTILDKCYGIMEEKQGKSKGSGKAGSSLAPHFAKLRDSTVQAMSNMLSANIDSGLMHSIGLGYHEDTQTRATFLEVLTDILRQVKIGKEKRKALDRCHA